MREKPTVTEWWIKTWKNSEGQYHQDNDLPAIIQSNGYYEWCINGKLHRDNDLPARIWTDGGYQWWQNNECHRDHDLPAVIGPDGSCSWYQHSEKIKEKYCTQEEIEQYKKPYYQQKKLKIKFNRFEKLIK